MKIILVGYNWCPYLKRTIVLLTKSSVNFSTYFVNNKAELVTTIQEICKDTIVQGHFSETSPQIFKITPDTVICIGGHDDLARIGAENLHTFAKINF